MTPKTPQERDSDTTTQRSAGPKGVVVAGAGAAGLAAAISAAREGVPVDLIESRSQMGGTVAHSLIHTLGGLFTDRGALLNPGLPEELVRRLKEADPHTSPRRMGRLWVLSVLPGTYRRVIEDWVSEESNIRVHLNCRVTAGSANAVVTSIKIDSDQTSVEGGLEGHPTLMPTAVVDATGSAHLVRTIKPERVSDRKATAGGLISRLRGMEPGTLDFPRGVALLRKLEEASRAGGLSRECAHAWVDQGAVSDEMFVKQMIPLDQSARPGSGVLDSILETYLEARDLIITFLRSQPGLTRVQLVETGEIGVRDGGTLRGTYVLTADDVRKGRRFSPSAGRCNWPIEYWDPAEGVQLEHLPNPEGYDIPMSSLTIPGIENLWVAGKCLSADLLAQSSARVVGSCWSMGEQAGKAAALFTRQRVRI